MTLAEFFLARIAEDEEAARAAIEPEEMHPYNNDTLPRMVPSDVPAAVRGYLGGTWGKHFARHDPARVLAECEVKRRIVALHTQAVWRISPQPPFMEPEPYTVPGGCVLCAHDHPKPTWPCDTLRILALPYADHPDYRKEWTA